MCELGNYCKQTEIKPGIKLLYSVVVCSSKSKKFEQIADKNKSKNPFTRIILGLKPSKKVTKNTNDEDTEDSQTAS